MLNLLLNFFAIQISIEFFSYKTVWKKIISLPATKFDPHSHTAATTRNSLPREIGTSQNAFTYCRPFVKPKFLLRKDRSTHYISIISMITTTFRRLNDAICIVFNQSEAISHFRIEQKTGSSRLFGGTKINNMPNMASRKFSYIPKVLCAAWNATIIIKASFNIYLARSL